MQNFLIGFKRFIKDRNTIAIVGVLLAVLLIYYGYNYTIKKHTDPVSVPYATVEIGPRTQITTNMVGTKKVPGGTTADVIRSKSMIIGQYVKSDYVIPRGSVFYRETLTTDWTDVKESLYANIDDKNTLVALSVNLETTYGNSIYPGNYIDLYFAGVDDGKLLIGKFIESIEVLGVVDSEGKNVFEQPISKIGNPSFLVFSVNEDYFLLLKKAEYIGGTLFPVPRNKNYSDNPKETKPSSEYIRNFIENQTIQLNEYGDKNESIIKFDDITINDSTNDILNDIPFIN